MKTNRLSFICLTVTLFASVKVSALDTFSCVRDLMPISEAAAFQSTRDQVEKPFMASSDYMVFPEVRRGTVSGFYIYTVGQAYYYDTAVAKNDAGKWELLSQLQPTAEHILFELVAQPSGLETVTLLYMPGYGDNATTQNGPVVLGTSLLPVVGAFVSRSDQQLRLVYHNPEGTSDQDLKKWIYERAPRKPATVKDVAIVRKMMQLSTTQKPSREALWAPLTAEFQLRKKWVQSHNLDEKAFKRLSQILQTTCRGEKSPNI